MVTIHVKKEDIPKQLSPLRYEGNVIFSLLFGEYGVGFFGIKDNRLFFIGEENIPDEVELEVPENTEEVQQTYVLAEYFLQKIAMTQDISIDVKLGEELEIITGERDLIITTMTKFLSNFEYSNRLIDGIRTGLV